ncbi:hypothetical protein PAECIP111893_03676 [Paenibacillus plantiphilus]|uniref:SLH domain-containing protein n=1 Tax=Paenibacillus plantiphilus TaxID=2905650 RepID=A0ABM9CHL3_9BACL|nr:S-layer homology domain-containing protein [Paenibacillus plantiphilus]CAH1213365.1 hypothetical protein PAECIP111893_03676 [Paenibacillus plantiphilus]
MKSLLNHKWLTKLLVVILFTTVTLSFGAEKKVVASACSGITPGATSACPIIITDADGLDTMRQNLGAHYALGADIDMSEYLSPGGNGYNGGDGWEPVGARGGAAYAFTGTFDGNGHTISNLIINSNAGSVGLFGVAQGATIRNVGLINVDVAGNGGSSDVGGLVGAIEVSMIENSYVTGVVSGVDTVGGLVGYATGTGVNPSRIHYSYAAVQVTGPPTADIGGLAGYMQGNVHQTWTYYDMNLTMNSSLGTGLTTNEMKSAASFYEWDFSPSGRWGIVEGATYPMHRATFEQIVLDELTVDNGDIAFTPSFASDVWTYSSRVTGEVGSVTVAVYTNNANSSVSIEGVATNSRSVSLLPGNNVINVTVLTNVSVPGAATDPYETNYTLNIIRENGTDFPHRITTASQLAAIGAGAYERSDSYELMNDIELSGLDWEPIGAGGSPFTGVFDGNRHVIRNLTVTGADDDAGLFAASSGTIRNIGLEDASVSGGSRVGGLVGSNSGTVSNAYVKGNVAGDEHVGGLIGLNSGAAAVMYTYAAGHVTGTDHMGGLIGENTGDAAANSYWDTEIGGLLISGGGEGKTTEDMRLAATYVGWDFAGTWAIMNGSTYPMFIRHFDAVKLQALSAASTDGVVSWTPAVFASAQGAYELQADRYVEAVNVAAIPAAADTAVTIGAAASDSAQVAVTAGSNVIMIRTDNVNGTPQGAYRLTIKVPAPEMTGLDIPAAHYYIAGDTLTFSVSYEGNIEVTGNPTIPVVIGEGADATTVYATYSGHPPGQQNKLIFTYVVQAGLVHANDLEIGTHIQLTDGAEIYAAGTTVPVSLALPAMATTGIIIDSVKPDITLSQQPASAVMTNDPVTVTVSADGTGSAIAATKWAEGLRAADYFAAEGHSLASGSFVAAANGTYTVYAEDEAGNSGVATIDIGNIIDELPQISLSHSPTQTSPSVSVTATAGVHGAANSVTRMNWLPGSHSAADFADGTIGTDIVAAGQFTVTENGTYTVYAKDAAGNEAVAEITISNIGMPPDNQPTEPAPVFPIPSIGPKIMVDASGGISILIHSSYLVKETLEDGTIVEHVVLTDGIIEQVLKLLGEAQRKFVTVVIDDSEQAVQVQFPAASLQKVKGAYPNTVFEVQLNGSSYQLQVNAPDLQQLSKQLGAALPSMHVNVLIAKVVGQQKEQLEQFASKAGLKLLGHAVDYKVIVSAGGQSMEVRDFGGTYIIRAIAPGEDMSGKRITAVWYDPEAPALSFVPAVTAARNDGRPEVAMKVPHNSIYAIMESAHKSFSDLNGHWARSSVELLASKLIVSGVSDSRFAPNDSITRAEFTALLVRALGIRTEQTVESAIFDDVAKEAWYAPVIEAGVKAGLVSGISKERFAPGVTITREQMAVMFNNAFTLLRYPEFAADHVQGILGQFDDHTAISPWAQSAVAQSVASGIILGADNAIMPSEPATRAQAVVMLNRFLQHVAFID